MTIFEFIKQPWPWYVAGAMIGLTVPALLLVGNKKLGISSSFRHICAACIPGNIKFFKYDWKSEIWNLLFVAGIFIGAFIAYHFMEVPDALSIQPETIKDLKALGITDFNNLMPVELFSLDKLFTIQGVFFILVGGFMVGFGTRYAGGCTSGHAIMGLSSLQWPSLVATISFMTGGIIMSNLIMPYLVSL